MREKKNIDRLFQEKFKDFEAAPPEFVWDNLEEILQKKKKRRVVPLWWRMGGIAAALVVGMLFMYPYFFSSTTPHDGNGVVYENQTTGKGNNNTKIKTGTPTPPNRNVQSQGPSGGSYANTPGKTVDAGSPDNSKSDDVNGKMPGATHRLQNRDAYAQTNGKNTTSKAQDKNNKSRIGQSNNNTSLANNTNNKDRQSNPDANDANDISLPDNGNRLNQQEQQVAEGNSPAQPLPQQGDSPIIKNGFLANNDDAQLAVTDSIPKEENELEKLRKAQEKEKEEKALAQNDPGLNKWNLKPQMGPLLYNSLSNGSPIDGQFASNTKTYDNQLSYGLGVNYALTSRLSVRSGINTVKLGYATEGVQFYASLNEGTPNVARTAQANIVVQNQQTPQTPINVLNSLAISDALPKETFNGSMVQRTGYIEVPVEMEYALLNKKFGINVIGGFSTLFLNENNVSVVSDQGLSTTVGEAQNLNNISFSTNLGLGFKYRFFKQLEASFEPTFKYQVNTYTRDAGNFRPYFIGLYTGISFSF